MKVPARKNEFPFDGRIVGLTSDSREVKPGFLFAALPGVRRDGRDFIADAVRRGAVAVLAPPGTTLDPATADVRLIVNENPRRLFALMAARFHGKQPETIAAVTGTNGKTSVAWFARQLWQAAGRPAACVGTLGMYGPSSSEPGNLTTPDPVALHRTLEKLARFGIRCVAMEASSHGLAQYRLDGVRLSAAGFTNLTRDHLDYHGSMKKYADAKRRLFSQLLPSDGAAVLNADAGEFESFRAAAQGRCGRVITYGQRGSEIRLDRLAISAGGQFLTLVAFGRRCQAILPIVGRYQVSNALCALGLVVACGEDPERMVAFFETLTAPPGRLERVAAHPNGAPVYVDYAHTPDALQTVLAALRPHVEGRIVLVFGCGGDRDRGKRPEMGRIGSRLADVVVVTDDNPRSEDPWAIRREIMRACSGAREIGDRAEAIRAAVSELRPLDALVIAGKGHETGQIVGDTVKPFSDAETARAAVEDLKQ